MTPYVSRSSSPCTRTTTSAQAHFFRCFVDGRPSAPMRDMIRPSNPSTKGTTTGVAFVALAMGVATIAAIMAACVGDDADIGSGQPDAGSEAMASDAPVGMDAGTDAPVDSGAAAPPACDLTKKFDVVALVGGAVNTAAGELSLWVSADGLTSFLATDRVDAGGIGGRSSAPAGRPSRGCVASWKSNRRRRARAPPASLPRIMRVPSSTPWRPSSGLERPERSLLGPLDRPHRASRGGRRSGCTR
jgi:hypothetical protein